MRRVFRQEGINTDDASNIAEADLPCAADSATVVPTEVHGKPTHDNCCNAVSYEYK
jgi:hypothetical protein